MHPFVWLLPAWSGRISPNRLALNNRHLVRGVVRHRPGGRWDRVVNDLDD
jgi:hypothetical protein